MEWKIPCLEYAAEKGKFVRVGNNVHTIVSDEPQTHKSLAHEDGVFDEIRKLRQEDPANVDAGLWESRYDKDKGRWSITLSGDSFSLRLPINSVAEEARARSAERLIVLSPNCTVYIIPDYYGYPQNSLIVK